MIGHHLEKNDSVGLTYVLIFVWEPPKKDWYILSFLKDIDHNTFWKILRDHLF